MPETAPPIAPDSGTTHASGSFVAQYSRGPAVGEGTRGFWATASPILEVPSSCGAIGDAGFRLKDILG